MAYSAYANPQPDYSGIDFASLSQLRREVLNTWLPMVAPSTEGDEKFDLLSTHAKCDERRASNPNFTTCGALPGWLFDKLGMKKLSNYGLSSVRDAAVKLGCWVKNDEVINAVYRSAFNADQRPSPGDVYLLCGLHNSNEILHIGVIVNPNGNRWWTADSGQGVREKQQALYVPRKYVENTRQLDGETYSAATNRPARRLIGWVNLDRAKEVS